jgi:hypothetical protein
VNKHRLKPKTPTANKHTKTSSRPASSKNNHQHLPAQKEASIKAQICAQKHHIMVAMLSENCQNTMPGKKKR